MRSRTAGVAARGMPGGGPLRSGVAMAALWSAVTADVLGTNAGMELECLRVALAMSVASCELFGKLLQAVYEGIWS